ncbi:hypothetical protein [Streptomyces sp. BE303]|uniref:hypothetical protein n=1 Tax=Streptomyces sp. BE303 TaxID=3002528 RepID=UPI002E774300|nr:hypothetical protein [Streptomyces sp. BE303]MED7948171.1 hypothetical protein [Streptomyces sp. BE303]
MRTHLTHGTVTLTFLAAVALPAVGSASAAPEPAYTCQAVLVDDINRVAGSGCTGGPSGYEGAGSIMDKESDTVWQCALLGSADDPDLPGKLTVVGVLGCERQGGDPLVE